MTFRAKPVFIAAISCIFLNTGAFAAPPEGKGKPDNPGQSQGQGQNKGGGKNNNNGNGAGKGYSGSGGGSNGKTGNSDSSSVTLRFAGITVSTARTYAHEYGLSGYSQLPPGIRKNLARGKPLPPGIAKKMVPGPMLARLPAYPGYEWRIAGSDLVLVAIATAVVADVLIDVFN
ncbi:anti-virulence regulator CigR family protein [Achromobacter sp. ACRQX]|uniref:anti-virulence regulator CigR family protein n=1 Tax=Achromobacter sp. ACRQX TaxID=2918181 RepID=UPI001EF3C39A|nr:anti-virulence regulator CigR family protein [Achromobacter sp. ACRQX]MCG7326283.1 RcnB family protein [Achromobacter sp. ACRQX]